MKSASKTLKGLPSMFNRFLNQPLTLVDQRDPVSITWGQLYSYLGSSQVIASALTYRLFEQAIRELSPTRPPRRDEMSFLTAFPGRGVLEGVEHLTRIVTMAPERLILDPEAGPAAAAPAYIGRFYFEVQIGSLRRGFYPVDGFFDETFSNQVATWQDKDMSDEEHDSYMSYKWNKAQSILNHKANLFLSFEVPALPLGEYESPSWYGLTKYADLHKDL